MIGTRFAYAFINKSCTMMKIERLKYFSLFFIQLLSLSPNGYKPFNPILGETFASIVYSPKISEDGTILDELDMDNPTELYTEQTSHHPPRYHILTKNKDFTMYGWREFTAVSSGNQIKGTILGPTTIKLNDGTIITIKFCNFEVNGLVVGKRTLAYTGNFFIEDKTNGLSAVIELRPKEKKGFLGSIFGKKGKNFPDYFKGFIAQTGDISYDKKEDTYSIDEKLIMSSIEGEWNSHCNIDGKNYWNSGEIKSGKAFKPKFVLPSDSHLREDIIFYKAGKNELAQFAKMNLEDVQRKDDKLRKKHLLEKLDRKKYN